MTTRQTVIDEIFDAVDGLTFDVELDGITQTYTIQATDTLFDPSKEAQLPMFSITLGAEEDTVSLMGFNIDCVCTVNLFGYVRCGLLVRAEDRRSRLSKMAEACVEALKQKFTDSTWLVHINCAFSIINFGPIQVEHAEGEEPLAVISFPLSVVFNA